MISVSKPEFHLLQLVFPEDPEFREGYRWQIYPPGAEEAVKELITSLGKNPTLEQILKAYEEEEEKLGFTWKPLLLKGLF